MKLVKLVRIGITISLLLCGSSAFAGCYDPPKAGISVDGGVHIDHYNKSFINKLKEDCCSIESNPGVRISCGAKCDPFELNIVFSQGKNTFYDIYGKETKFKSNHISINPTIAIPLPIFGKIAYDKGEGHVGYISFAPDFTFNPGRKSISFDYKPFIFGGTYQFKIMFSNGIYFGTGFNHDLTSIGNYKGTKIKEHSFLFNFGWLIEFWKWID